MKMKALDQIHISSVKPDSLRPGEEFEVSDDFGKTLLQQHPAILQQIGGAKAEVVPKNKARPAPANKSAGRGKTKA